jgi:hypothetical protein
LDTPKEKSHTLAATELFEQAITQAGSLKLVS